MASIWLALAAAPALADPVPADDPAEARVAEMLARARDVYGIRDSRTVCRPSTGDEIVVCADHGRDQRMPSTAESDPNSLAARRALDGNIPSAPDVDYIRCHRGADGVCRGNFGGAPQPVYYVDLKALPEPPAGSEADQIAKGDKPAP